MKLTLEEVMKELDKRWHNHESLDEIFNDSKKRKEMRLHISDLAIHGWLRFEEHKDGETTGRFCLSEQGEILLQELK